MSKITRGDDTLLDDVLVVELGDRVAAGACGGLLARLGATVVVVEPPVGRTSDKWRDRAVVMAGKSSIVIDEETSDRRLLEHLLEAADVILMSSDRGDATADAWNGPGRERPIVCDITAFGRTGPAAGRGMSEALIQAVAGIAHTTGPRDGAPAVTGAPFLEMETAVYAAAAVLAALRARDCGQGGQRIDMAIYDVAVNALLTFIPLHLTGRPATRNGNRHPTSAPWNAYRASDGWVLICGPTNDQWRRLCLVMGRPELVEHELYSTPSLRFENVEAMDREIQSWVGGLTVQQCLEQVAASGIPCSSILSVGELEDDPNLRHRRMIMRVPDPVTGQTVRVPGNPFRVSGWSDLPPHPVPLPDQDRARVEALLSRGRGSARRSGRRPIAELRVVEIGMNTVAPLAAKQLGALGADVIKIEPPSGDANRINAPLREDGESYIFALSNTDKRGMVLDLKQPDDLERLWRLLETADIVIENLKPGSLGRLGVGADQVLARLPGIVYCSVNGFGFDSAYPGRPALDTVIQAMSGAMSSTIIDGMPTKAGISISDQLGGQFGLVAILAALNYRERTGKGLHLDLAMQDCSAWSTHTLWNTAGRWPEARMVEASDGYVVAESDDPALTLSDRSVTRSALADRLNALPGTRAAPVRTVAEVIEDEHTRARDLMRTVPTVDGREWLVLNSPLKLLRTPANVRSAMPTLGYRHMELEHELAHGGRKLRSGGRHG